MEIKFDTKETYTVITPETDTIDDNLTALLAQNIDLYINKGSNNFIIDLQHCEKADNTSFEGLLKLHEHCYAHQQSLVLTGLSNNVADNLKKNDTEQTLNTAPTMIEAVDIVSMEILERDLLNEDDE